MIDLERLKELQESISFMDNIHLNVLSDKFDIPDDLRTAWYDFLEYKKKLNAVMEKYGFEALRW